MRNSSILIIGIILLLALAGCTEQAGSPPNIQGEPVLSIGDSMDKDSQSEQTDNTNNSTSTPSEEPERGEDLPTKRVKEGDLVSYSNLQAEDPDGDPIELTFSEPLNNNGEWQTKRGDAGTYIATITASDGETTTRQDVRIIAESINTAPTLSVSDVTVDEGQTVELDIEAEDADGDELTITITGWMESDTQETSAKDIGTHKVTVSVADEYDTISKEVTVTVNDVNHAPQLSSIDDITVTEGDLVLVLASATDKDGDSLTYSFSEPLDESGEWQTQSGDEGQYTVRVTVSDGEHNDSKDVDIIVEHLNAAPQLELEQDVINVEETETVRIEYSVEDPEGDDVSVTFSGWMESDTYTTTYDDAGEYTVTVTADDGQDSVSKDVTIVVADKNRPPVFDKGSFS